MTLLVDNIIAKFPVKNIPAITGEPDYEAINNMVQTLYGNAASLARTLGGGRHGHIGIIMSPPSYATLTATPYISPNDPVALPIIPQASAAPAREQIRTLHQEERQIYTDNDITLFSYHLQTLLVVITNDRPSGLSTKPDLTVEQQTR